MPLDLPRLWLNVSQNSVATLQVTDTPETKASSVKSRYTTVEAPVTPASTAFAAPVAHGEQAAHALSNEITVEAKPPDITEQYNAPYNLAQAANSWRQLKWNINVEKG